MLMQYGTTLVSSCLACPLDNYSVDSSLVSACVLMQVAIPMLLYALEHPKNWDEHALTDVLYLTDVQARNPAKHYSTAVTAVHPWGLSAHHEGSSVLEAMSEGDPLIDVKEEE